VKTRTLASTLQIPGEGRRRKAT